MPLKDDETRRTPEPPAGQAARPSGDETVRGSQRVTSRRVSAVLARLVAGDRLAALEKENARLLLLLDTAQDLGSEVSLDLLMTHLVERTSRIMDCDRSSVFLLDAERNELYALVAQGLDAKEIRVSAAAGLAGYVARTGERLNVPDAYADPRFSPEVDRQTGYRTRSVLALPLLDRKGDVLGVIQCLNKTTPSGGHGPFDAGDEGFLEALGVLAATFLESAKLYRDLDQLLEAVVSGFSRAIDDRDPCTSGHTRRVTQLTLQLARAVHDCQEPPFDTVVYTRERLRQLRYATLLHDVGKIGVREYILCKADKLPVGGLENLLLRLELVRQRQRGDVLKRALAGKLDPAAALEADYAPCSAQVDQAVTLVTARNKPAPVAAADLAQLATLKARGWITDSELECFSIQRGNLTPAELVNMQSHVGKSHEMLRTIPWPRGLRDVPEVAYSHHERRDGSGYPRHLKADEIHFDGQVMAIADVYDALVASDRPYKRAIPHPAARKILEEEANQRHTLNATLVRLFFDKECYKLPDYETRITRVT